MFPEVGINKGEVLRFYERIAPRLLPHLRDRPMTVERFPEGLTGTEAPHFWQKNIPAYYRAWIPRATLPSEDGQLVTYALVNDTATLLYLVNQNTLTFHPWLSRIQHLDQPDFVIFDLDPGAATFADAVVVTCAPWAEAERNALVSASAEASELFGDDALEEYAREHGPNRKKTT